MTDIPEKDLLETQWKTMMAVIDRSTPLFHALARAKNPENRVDVSHLTSEEFIETLRMKTYAAEDFPDEWLDDIAAELAKIPDDD